MGWHLNISNDSDPITVDKIMHRKGHPIYNYNLANPTNMVQVGDSILRVNDITWHGNTQKFAERIEKEFEKARPRHAKVQNEGPQNATLELLMHRASTPDLLSSSLELHMQRRLVMPISKEWHVTVPAEDGDKLGWKLNYTDDEFPLTVENIRTDGVVFQYNQEHPDQRIVAGDVIVMVNDELWREDSPKFKARLNELFSKAKKNGNITFYVRRPAWVRDTTNDLSADRPFFK
jgi:hypothetical protein